MHPAWGHIRAMAEDPDGALDGRIEVARHSGVPAAALERYESPPRREPLHRSRRPARSRARRRRRGRDRPRLLARLRDARPRAFARRPPRAGERPARLRRPPARPDLALLRHGHTPDPVAEFIASLDVVDELDIRLCLPGHGRTFRDVGAKIAAYRKEVDAQLGTVRDALRDGEKTPFGVVEAMLGEGNTSGPAAAWALQLSLAYLDHLETLGEAERAPGTDPVLWRSTG